MPDVILIYLMLGMVAGITAGLLGVGGGLIIVPALVVIFQAQSFDGEIIMHLALGTSLATIMFTGMSAVLAHHRRGAVEWRLVARLVPGLLLGSFAGAFLADGIGGEQLKWLFAVFEFVVGVYMLLGTPKPYTDAQVVIRMPEFWLVGSAISLLSALLGIGGGTMTVPYLSWRGVNIRKAVAVSSACGIPIAFAGACGYVFAGLDSAVLPAYSTGYIYWPGLAAIVAASLLTAPLGARIAHGLPLSQLKRLFGIVLIALAEIIIFI